MRLVLSKVCTTKGIEKFYCRMAGMRRTFIVALVSCEGRERSEVGGYKLIRSLRLVWSTDTGERVIALEMFVLFMIIIMVYSHCLF